MSLISKAKSYQVKRMIAHEPTKEEVDLAIAWAKGEVTLTQCAYALGKKVTNSSGSIAILARALATKVR